MQTRRHHPGSAHVAALLVTLLFLGACTSASAPSPEPVVVTPASETGCIPSQGPSVARIWNEATLAAIRRDFPAPVIHARNLFHVAAAMWDAWAAYEPGATGYFVDESHSAPDVADARREAISYAAYGILVHRYREATGGAASLSDFDEVMESLCLDPAVVDRASATPAALGNRIAARIIEFGSTDGALEGDAYHDRSYSPVNDPLVVVEAGTTMRDPNRWQPLRIEGMRTQNDVVVGTDVQEFIGSQWGSVASFALPVGRDLPIDPGPPPYLGDPSSDADFKAAAVEVIRASSQLDHDDGVRIDIGPGSWGDNPLGTNDGEGHPLNPVTGQPYAIDEAWRGDFGRVVAEYWADGPRSETPPGHWNTLANQISDHPDLDRLVGGIGAEVDRLEWDVKLYFALNGAAHDAAVAAWGAKAHYDYVRPISMIRYMGGLGQSSDPDGPAYHPDGLPLEPGLVEVITPSSTAAGQPHEALRAWVGEVAILAWAGNRNGDSAGVRWMRAVEWTPYQKGTFVSPAFAGYVSGHSAFSRAAAEVLSAMTGSPFFPGGVGTWTVPIGALEFEPGPREDVTLQWATYFDAADQAGLSRIYGGIHVAADDLRGREIGAQCGQAAWALALTYFDGTATSLPSS